MKELSLNILDITENSVKANATLTEIILDETDDMLTLTIKDDGCGMSEDMVRSVVDPFCTTRTTRKVGLGIPLLKLAAEQTGGRIDISSKTVDQDDRAHGTIVNAIFYKNHIDFTPLGDIISTLTTLIQGHPDTDFLYIHKNKDNEVRLDTREIRAVLEDVPLNSYDVIVWTRSFLSEQYEQFLI